MSDNQKQTIVSISQERLDRYTEFLNTFGRLVLTGQKNFVSKLIKEYQISAPTLTVMRNIGLVEGTGHKGYKLHFKIPIEPIMTRRILVGLYHYGRLYNENIKREDAEFQLQKAIEAYDDNKDWKFTTKEIRAKKTEHLLEAVLSDPTGKQLLEQAVKPRYARKSNKPVTVEVKMFGIPWYKCTKADGFIKIHICWMPIYSKKIKK